MAITSQIRESAVFGEAAIVQWEEAGLLKASVVKPVFATIERGLILKALGRLEADDRLRLKAAMTVILG